ncbi:hypothetical protein ACFQV2_31395 [Actinokineospora soli]|uniref:Tetratricopeptide repeat-containing protein n=1 Tax=Actinokineospora soli TaxID=1048753 RepID=A0ABW2TWW5_9PSEU
MSAENPGKRADLAGGLLKLGARYAEVGRLGEALATTEEALALCKAEAAERARCTCGTSRWR